MQAHGLGRIVHAPVRGRHDVLPQHRQNTGLQRDRNSYPSFAFAGSPAVFVIVSLVEVVLATLIIMGLWVRASAIVMAAGILGVLLWGAPGFGTLAFTWLGVYVFLAMSGGGLYAFDTALFPAKRKN